jgi:hypothetical protein
VEGLLLIVDVEQEIRDFLPLMKERQREVKRLRLKLGSLNWDDVRRSEQYYPLRFFADGLSAYIYAFDNAAVFYAWAAVEQALLIRLGAHALSQAVARNNNRYPGEKQLITIAKENGIISWDRARGAHRLRKLRNNYIHYINVMWDHHRSEIRLHKLMDSQWPEVVQRLREATPNEKQVEVAALLAHFKKETDAEHTILKRQVPYIPGEPPGSESTRFRNLRVRRLVAWAMKAKDAQTWQKRHEYGIERKDALDCLRWSSSLLMYLDFLPNR